MSKTRLLLVTDEMEVGGSQRQIVEIAMGLDRSRYAPELLYFREPSHLVDDLQAAGVPVHRVDKRGRFDLGFLFRILQFFRKERFDIVHAFSFTGEVWSALAMMLNRRRPLLASIRGVYEWNSPAQWRAKRWVTGRAAATIANSEAGAEFAAKAMNWPRERIDVVYNGIDATLTDHETARRKADAEFDFARDVPLVIFVGRFVVDKNLELLVDAAERLTQAGTPFNLLMVGDGPMRSDIMKAVESRGLSSQVAFAGQRGDARSLIAASDVLVLCSHREGLSNVILEAMAEARPVVASAVGGNCEIVVDGDTGLLFEDDDGAALADALGRLLANPHERERMGSAGRQRVLQSFAREKMIAALDARYQACVGDAR